MIALSLIASLVAVASSNAAPHEPVPPTVPYVRTTLFVPYGELEGAWASGAFLHDGFLTGVMTDANGVPLWVLDASLDAKGWLNGRLLVLEYAGNPALGYLELAAWGKAAIGRDGKGTFHAWLYSPYEDDVLPVYPRGEIEGVLHAGWPGLHKPGQSPAAPDASAGGLPAGPGHEPAGVIVCPKGPEHALSGVSHAGAHAAAGKQPTRPGADVAPCYKAREAVLTGKSKAAGLPGLPHNVPPSGAGLVEATWYVKP